MPIITGPLPTVIYPKPREEQPTQEPQPSVEQQESQRFWTAQGYPQYAGRYKPIDLQGRQIESVVETPEGLKVTFRGQPVLPRTQGIRGAIQSILERKGSYLSPSQTVSSESQLPSQELVRVQYPELKGNEPERFMAENIRAWTAAGYPQYGSLYTFPFGTGISQGWRTKSISLVPYGKGNELIWTIEQFATYTLTPEAQAQQTASQEFYAKIGYPQFGGQYAPFDIPSGFKVASVKETYAFPPGGGALESRLAVSFESLEPIITQPMGAVKPSPINPSELRRNEYKDFGQLIADVKANAGTSSLARDILKLQTQIPEVVQKYGIVGLPSPLAGIVMGAYEVAAFERLVNPYAPSLVEGLTGGKQALVGTLVGEAALMVIGGKVFSWVIEGTPNPIKLKAESWLSGSYEEAAKGGELWQPSVTERIVMRATGAKPYLVYGEVSIPVVETVSKVGMVSSIPSGLPYTDVGWELTIAPRMGGVFKTKMPTATSERALELFFGFGEELVSFNVARGQGEPLGFQKEVAKVESVEKGLPSSMLDESYYPKLGGFDRSLKFVDVRALMEEGKLLPFTTQTQVTRMGIFPYVSDIAMGETAKTFRSAFLAGLGMFLVPRAFSQTRPEPKAMFEPLIKLKQPTFEEPFEIQKLKLFPSLTPKQKEKQRAIPLVTVELGLAPSTEAMSVQSSMLETEQVQSLAQIQKQVQRQVQSLTQQFRTPSLQRHTTAFNLPTETTLKRRGKKRVSKKRGQGLYLWEFPILEPEKVWKLK